MCEIFHVIRRFWLFHMFFLRFKTFLFGKQGGKCVCLLFDTFFFEIQIFLVKFFLDTTYPVDCLNTILFRNCFLGLYIVQSVKQYKSHNSDFLDEYNPPWYCTEVRFASFLSGWFITVIVVNLPEMKLAKRTSVFCVSLKTQTL